MTLQLKLLLTQLLLLLNKNLRTRLTRWRGNKFFAQVVELVDTLP